MINWGLNPRSIFNLPLEYAAARGVFGKGLALEFHNHLTGAHYGARLKAGAFDIGQIGTPVYFPAVAAGDDYEIVTVGICNYPPFYLVADPAVRSLAALRGATVAINKRGTCAENLLLWHAHQEKVSEHDLRVLEVMAPEDSEDYGAAFIKGAGEGGFKAGVLYEPYVTYMEGTAGWKIIGEYPRIISPSNYCLLLYVRKSWARANAETLNRLVSDYFAAVEYARGHLEDMISTVAPLPFVSGSQLLAALRREVSLWNTAPLVDHAVFQRACDELRRQGRILANYRPLVSGESGSRSVSGQTA